jgi:hypothetical protein
MQPPSDLPAQGSAQWAAGVKTTSMRYSLATATKMRGHAERAYETALESSKSYNAQGIALTRYDLEKYRTEFEYWCDVVNEIERFGSTQHPIFYRRVIPIDL